MKTLAEHLGVTETKTPDIDSPTAPRARNKSAKQHALDILNSVEYKTTVLQRIVLGTLPAQIEALLYHYAYGKPVEQLEVRDVTESLEDLPAERLEHRALFLAELARKMRQTEHETETDSSMKEDSIH